MANNGPKARKRNTAAPNPLGSPVMWAAATSLLWAITALVPCAVRAALDGKVESLGTTDGLIALGVMAGAGLILGLLWRGAVGKTALGLTLLIVILTATGAYIGAGPVYTQLMSGASTLNLSTNNLITAGAFAFQSAWFVLAFSIRRVNQKSAWWLLPLAAIFSVGLAFVPA